MRPQLTCAHGICPPRHAAVVAALDDPAVGAAGTVTLGALHSVQQARAVAPLRGHLVGIERSNNGALKT